MGARRDQDGGASAGRDLSQNEKLGKERKKARRRELENARKARAEGRDQDGQRDPQAEQYARLRRNDLPMRKWHYNGPRAQRPHSPQTRQQETTIIRGRAKGCYANRPYFFVKTSNKYERDVYCKKVHGKRTVISTAGAAIAGVSCKAPSNGDEIVVEAVISKDGRIYSIAWSQANEYDKLAEMAPRIFFYRCVSGNNGDLRVYIESWDKRKLSKLKTVPANARWERRRGNSWWTPSEDPRTQARPELKLVVND